MPSEPSDSRAAFPRSTLGRTGAKVSRLGIGCAYFQRKHVTPDDVTATLHRALELGVNYLDTAPNYGSEETGFAEEKMGPAIREMRDKFFLVTKTEEPTYEGTWKLLQQSMKRMQTDRLDLVHLHNFGDAKMWGDHKLVFGDKGAMGALREAKKQGVVRFIGASGHLHPTRFHEALDSGEIDVLMNAVNFVVQHTYDFEHKVWSRAQSLNVGLVAMKVLGGAAPQSRRLQDGREVLRAGHPLRPLDPRHLRRRDRPGEHPRAGEGRRGRRPQPAALPRGEPGAGPRRPGTLRHAGMEDGLRDAAGVKLSETGIELCSSSIPASLLSPRP